MMANQNFEDSLKSLQALYEIDKDDLDNNYVSVPTKSAYYDAHRLLVRLKEILQETFPYCCASLESRGGIDLVWSNKELNRKVWVTVPFDHVLSGFSIYYREHDKSWFINKLDFTKLCELLLWIKGDINKLPEEWTPLKSPKSKA